jgi:hypothetical protein
LASPPDTPPAPPPNFPFPTPNPHLLCRWPPQVESIFFNLPNLHFIPCTPVVGSKFNNDVYFATSEPHGNIECVVTRKSAQPHSKL